MENRSHALIAGLFTVVLTICIAAAAMWLNRDTVQRTPYLLVTTGSVAGLNPRAAVRYRGMEVGKVEAIEFDKQKPGQILVRIGVKPSTPVTTATFAELGMQGLTGLAYIQLDVDERAKDAKIVVSTAAAPARLTVRPSILDRFSVSGEDLMVSASNAMNQINKLLDDDKQKLLVNVLGDLQGVSARIGKLTDEIVPVARSFNALAGDGRRVLNTTNLTIAGAGHTLKNADQTMKNADVALVAVGKLAADINQRLDFVDRIAKSAEQIGQSTAALESQALPRLNLLLDDTIRGVRTIDRTAERLGDEPSSVLFGPQPGLAGPGEPGFVAPAGAAR